MASSNYTACLAKVLKYEGGYANHPSDPGGETNYGITIAVARANGYHGDMRSIPMDLVRKIYRKGYWDRVNGDDLPAGLDLCVFDFAVNSGPRRALDAMLSGYSVEDRINRYCDTRLAFLRRLKTWGTFGKGWSSRVADVRKTALAMAGVNQVGVPPPPDVEPIEPRPKPAPKPPTKETGGAIATGGGGAIAINEASKSASNGEIAVMIVVLVFVVVGVFFLIRHMRQRS